MYDIITIVLGLIIMFAIVGGVAYFLENRAKKKGNLFTQPASLTSRIVAFLLGLIFAGSFVVEILYTDRFHVVIPILAVLLIAYSLGFNRLIATIQKNGQIAVHHTSPGYDAESRDQF